MSETPDIPGPPALDMRFIRRVYRTSGVLAVLAALFLWEGVEPRSSASWLLGVGLSLLSLAATERTVRRTIQTGKQSTILTAAAIKFPAIGIVLLLLFLGAQRRWVNLIWVLAGFALPHVVLVLKLVGQKVLELYRDSPEGGN